MSVKISVENDRLHLSVQGFDKLLTFKTSLEVPLEHVSSVRIDPEIFKAGPSGVKVVGAGIPGLVRAGTWAGTDGLVFWDVRHADRVLVIELHDERYRQLVVEVEDPPAVLALIQGALERRE